MWTNIPKPTGTTYTDVESFLPDYDEASLTYDSAITFYDGVNQNQWTKLTKPSTSWTNIPKPT